jgi:sensor c-di-GMP phosphodiesterase-like protein
MRKSIATVLTLIAVLLAIAVPILLAISLADRQSLNSEQALVTAYASDVLRRSESTADQILAATDALAALQSPEPCSDSNITLMRRFDFASTYIQAIGYLADGRMLCSSQGRETNGIALGPVDWVTPINARMRINAKFPFDPQSTYLVVESRSGYAEIINKDLPIETTTSEKDASLSAFSTFNGRLITSRGFVEPKWVGKNLSTLPAQRSVNTFVDGGYVVAVVVSNRFYLGAIAALPVHHMRTKSRATAAILLPVGVISGVLLATVTLYLGRLQMAMPSVVKMALKRHEFFMVYQPVVDLRTLQWVGAEALIRWRRPGGEMVRPDLFIQVAEDAGLIPRITQRVVELVARDVDDLFVRCPDFHIAINLSSTDLHSEDTVGLLSRLAKDTRATRGNLIVEVTERGLVKRDPAQRIVHDLRTGGVRVAIDDFGTGYSSLSFLESFELDFLKIDKSFVDTMNLDTPTSQVALHIIAMAKSLSLEMIAEGVETEAQAQLLREQGVQYAQGWLFGRPMPMHELIQYIHLHSPHPPTA